MASSAATPSAGSARPLLSWVHDDVQDRRRVPAPAVSNGRQLGARTNWLAPQPPVLRTMVRVGTPPGSLIFQTSVPLPVIFSFGRSDQSPFTMRLGAIPPMKIEVNPLPCGPVSPALFSPHYVHARANLPDVERAGWPAVDAGERYRPTAQLRRRRTVRADDRRRPRSGDGLRDGHGDGDRRCNGGREG